MADDAATATEKLTAVHTGATLHHAEPAPESDGCEPDPVVGIQDGVSDRAASDAAGGPQDSDKDSVPATRRAMQLGLGVTAVLIVMVGWLGFRVYQSEQAQGQRMLYLQAAEQVALNLTTIDWHHADSDVRRVLDGATGEFYDDFAKRSKPFVDVVKEAKSTTVGTIASAGLEADVGATARALVALTVKSTIADQPEQAPRAWRMRLSLQKIGDQAKVSDVEFVP